MYMFVFGYIAGASYSYKEIYNLDSKTFGLVFGATGSALLFGALLSTKLLEVFNMKQLSISGSAIIIFGSIISFISSNIDMIGLDGIVIGFFISFFGLGLAEASLFSIAMSSQKTSFGFNCCTTRFFTTFTSSNFNFSSWIFSRNFYFLLVRIFIYFKYFIFYIYNDSF